MKPWLRRTLVAALLIVLTLVGLYEYATHVGRGWLRGEAFYEGRPTSYWALRCDEWLDRFDDDNSLAYMTYFLPYQIPGDEKYRRWSPDIMNGESASIKNPPETTWTRFRNMLRSKSEVERDAKYESAPPILWGSPDTDPVLRELQSNDRYRRVAEVGLKRIEYYHKVEAVVAQQAKEEASQ